MIQHLSLIRGRLPRRRILLAVFAVFLGTGHCGSGRVEEVQWREFRAYRLTDGRSEAVVVPALAGRVMVYGRVGGHNLIWNIADADREKTIDGEFINWGGDKTLAGPHGLWFLHADSFWPPPRSWLGDAHEARVVANGAELETLSPLWEGLGLRIRRRYRFVEGGGLEIVQRFEKETEGPLLLALWSVSQVVVPEEVFVPLPESDRRYVGNQVRWRDRPSLQSEVLRPGVGRVTFHPGGANKLSFDSPRAALAARFGEEVWVQTASLRTGKQNPKPGLRLFPVEIYHHAEATGAYAELELSSPEMRLSPEDPVEVSVVWTLLDRVLSLDALHVLLTEKPE